MRTSAVACVACVCLGISAFPPAAQALTRYVDCDEGQTISDAIDKAASRADRLEIFVSGTCREAVLVRRSDVTIDGMGTAIVEGRISALADRVWIYNITVRGAGVGVTVSDGSARLWNVNLLDNAGHGLRVHRNGFAYLRGQEDNPMWIAGNGGSGIFIESGRVEMAFTNVHENHDDGIRVEQNGSLTMEGGSIQFHHGGSGLVARVSSSAVLENVQISDNADMGVLVNSGSSGQLSDTYVNNNGTQGLEVAENSSLEFSGGEIAANGEFGLYASTHALVRLIDTTVHQNASSGVLVSTDAGLIVLGPTVVDYNGGEYDIACEGEEASLYYIEEEPPQIGSTNCSGF